MNYNTKTGYDEQKGKTRRKRRKKTKQSAKNASNKQNMFAEIVFVVMFLTYTIIHVVSFMCISKQFWLGQYLHKFYLALLECIQSFTLSYPLHYINLGYLKLFTVKPVLECVRTDRKRENERERVHKHHLHHEKYILYKNWII